MKEQKAHSREAFSPEILSHAALGVRKIIRTMIELNETALHRMKEGNYAEAELALADRARLLGKLRLVEQGERLDYMICARRELALINSLNLGSWFSDEYKIGLDLVGYSLTHP